MDQKTAEYSSKRIKKVITLTLHAKMAKSDSPRFLFKALSDKVCIKNRSLNGLISIVIFLAQYYWKKI